MGRGGAKKQKNEERNKSLPVDDKAIIAILETMLVKEGASKAEARASLRRRDATNLCSADYDRPRRLRFSNDYLYHHHA